MVKPFNQCVACGVPRFVNFAGLCKRCSKNAANAKIVSQAIEEHAHELEARAEDQHELEEQQQAQEAAAAEAEDSEETAAEEEEKPAA